MSVTKRDFQATAEVLAEQFYASVRLFQDGDEEAAKVMNRAVRAITNEMARYFRSQNPSFDWGRFEHVVFGMDRVIGVWYGGSSYAEDSDPTQNMEWFESEEDAKNALRGRRRDAADGFEYVFRTDRNGYVDTPGVDENSSVDLYQYHYDGPRLNVSDEPYARIFFGPRGGVRREFV